MYVPVVRDHGWIYFAVSVKQDQTANTCSLILHCTICCSLTQPLPLDQLKIVCNCCQPNNKYFKFDEKDRKFSNRVENAVGKETTALFEQFLLFPQCFQKTCTADKLNISLFGKGLDATS